MQKIRGSEQILINSIVKELIPDGELDLIKLAEPVATPDLVDQKIAESELGNVWYPSVKTVKTSPPETLFEDWFLPSKDELNLMYLNLAGAELDTWQTTYWSSSESSALQAWIQNFSDGSQSANMKGASAYIRAIRMFIGEENDFEIGDKGESGGYIFHKVDNLDTTFTYYECSPVESEASGSWSNVGTTEIGTTSTDVGEGINNTDKIIAQAGHTSSAALTTSDLEVSLADGSRYLVSPTPSEGEWFNKANQIAQWDSTNSIWEYTIPTTGKFVSREDVSDGIFQYSGSGWLKKSFEVNSAGNGIDIDGDGIVSVVTKFRGGLAVDVNGVYADPDTTTIVVNPSGQIGINPAGVTETQLNSSVAGAGIAGGEGTALSIDRVTEKFTATASQTEFTLTNTPAITDGEDIFVNGILQDKTADYTLSGTTLTFTSGLTAGDKVTAKFFK